PTGEEIWKEKLGDTYFSSPILVDDRIYAVSRRADVVVFRASDEFEILGRTLINQGTNATPIVDNGRLYLRTVSHLYCLSGE
ncbi:MAG: PQQ-binding-like beta-propeller repeat protein, partial [Verrucomicrobia bacterium]|nr:PQQ-binding-like beta-propeller repeat protein [Verrucomicrobiota bacterium]